MKKIDVELHGELQKISGSMTAFSTAVVLLAAQKTISLEGQWPLVGLAMVAFSIPLGVSSYVLCYKLRQFTSVPRLPFIVADNLSTFGITLSVVGFIFILLGTNMLLGIAVAVSAILSFLIGITALFVLRRHERKFKEDHQD